jgi:hypothetical protein
VRPPCACYAASPICTPIPNSAGCSVMQGARIGDDISRPAHEENP